MISKQNLVCDNSTLVNFKGWAMAISNFFAAAGWVKTADTGQVDWATISAVPATDVFVYEVWKPGDAFTTFFLKIEYGNKSSSNTPSVRLTVSQSTDGAGNITGSRIGPFHTAWTSFIPPSTTVPYPCYFTGDAGRIAVALWNGNGQNGEQLFAIERSVDAGGAYTGAYVTLYAHGLAQLNPYSSQQTLLFGVGAAPPVVVPWNTTPPVGYPGSVNWQMGFGFRRNVYVDTLQTAFNGSIPIDMAAPCLGYWDYPSLQIGVGAPADLADGIAFQATVIGGVTRTFMPIKKGLFGQLFGNGPNSALILRWE